MEVSNLDRARLQANLERVCEQIEKACDNSGRDSKSVQLVAVTKYVDARVIQLLTECGQLDFGESRPQQFSEKAEELDRADIRWHLIGHLQRNKVRSVVPRATLIHSIDSLRLAEAVNEESRRHDCTSRCLLEINISGDAAKHGFKPDELEPTLARMAELAGLKVCGLMAMSGLNSGEDESLRQFHTVRELRNRLQQLVGDRFLLTELSMGMSGDFPQAIAAGSTLVRIGSALFE